MSAETELRQWLNRPENDFLTNLKFGIKVWNSIEFVLITKHEIIAEEFCNNVSNLKKIRKKSLDEYNDAWILINEFLNLNCSPGAISSTVKKTLVDVLSMEASKTIKHPQKSVLKGLLLVLHSPFMQNYYKSKGNRYAEFIGEILKYLSALIQMNQNAESVQFYEESINQILVEIKAFTKATPFLDVFQSGFLKNAIVPLSELVIQLHNHFTTVNTEWRDILKEIYFPTTQSDLLKKYFQNKIENKTVQRLFAVPNYTFLMLADILIMSYRLDHSLLGEFLKFLFENYYQMANEIHATPKDLLNSMTFVIYLLKKHDVQLNFEIAETKSINFLGKNIEMIFKQYYSTNLHESMSLICEILKLNPMIVEQSIFGIVARCMISAKDDQSMKVFEDLICLVIDVYKRLGRSEKFVVQLIKSLTDVLSTVKLSKKLKRKSAASGLEEIPKKLHKDSEGQTNGTADPVEEICKTFLEKMIALNIQRSTKQQFQLFETDFWPTITFAWPPIVGNSFAKFISGLMSKPSLVVWKTIIFTLADYVELIQNGHFDENSLFKIEYASALLAQYFTGCRLAEHADQMWELIQETRRKTQDVLKTFGMAILSQEHNIRTMNAYLKVCYSAGSFDLLCWYYRPDSFNNLNGKMATGLDELALADRIHSYLLPEEWTLIEQRITNFGKDECRSNINKLFLQKYKSQLLFPKDPNSNHHLLSSTLSDLNQISIILKDDTIAPWFIGLLNKSEIIDLGDLILSTSNADQLLVHCDENHQFTNIFVICIFKQFQQHFHTSKSILNRTDFAQIFDDEHNTVQEIVEKIREHIGDQVKIKKYSADGVQNDLVLLKRYSAQWMSSDVKNVVFILAVALFCDIKATENVELLESCKDLLKALLHFGETPNLSKYLNIVDLQKIFSEQEISIFSMIFEIITKDLNSKNIKMIEIIYGGLKMTNDFDQIITVSVCLLEQMAKEKKSKEYFIKFRNLLLEKIKFYFSNFKKNKTPEFVLRTLSGFTTIMGSILTRAEDGSLIDEHLKMSCQKYLQNSIDCNNSSALKLLNLTITNKKLLDVSEDEIKSLINDYWQQYLEKLKTDDHLNAECSESFLKLIFANKTNEELVEMFTKLESSDINEIEGHPVQYKIFKTVAKLLLNKVKGGIFIEAFKQFSFRTISSAKITIDPTKFVDLLECQKLIADNNHLPVSIEFIDDILLFLAELNIKKFQITASNTNAFVALHSHMTDVCESLIHYRHFFIADRIPQFTAILKDLIQAICWYKSDRRKDEHLENPEITMIAELAHKLENIFKALVKHTKNVKRVAPYLLIHVMHLMTSNERPTTLYPKIKTHIELICYDLISACDHHVESFIMRNCNEAMKPIYEQFIKDYNKYHKFKGKV